MLREVRRAHPFSILVALGAVIGFAFATVSTYDFMIHLDRQLHGIHCSYIPGLGGGDDSGSSGCHAALMSPYSSVLRESLWGGLPVSLPGVSIFAFLLFLTLDLMITRRQADLRALGLLLATATVPALTSAVMGYIAVFRLGAVCKSCVGIYTGSAIAFAFALALVIRTLRMRRAGARATPAASGEGQSAPDEPPPDPGVRPRRSPPGPMSFAKVLVFMALGGAFMVAPIIVYLAVVPSFERFVGACGALPGSRDAGDVLLSLGGDGARAIEVIDPLCASCRGLERRMRASKLDSRLHRELLLFPLDGECNWMIDRSVHPGACALSEALLCAGDGAGPVLEWVFEEQEQLLEASKADPSEARRRVVARFPELGACVGGAAVKARLNRALRWAVGKQLPILVPQLYVEGTKLCDEDTDLGLEYMLPRLIERSKAGPRVARSGGGR